MNTVLLRYRQFRARLSCEATWIETNAQIYVAPSVQSRIAPIVRPSGGEIQIEIDGVDVAIKSMVISLNPHCLAL